MNDVTITHHPEGEGGRYIAEVAGSDHTGYLEWEPAAGNVRVAAHTVVPPAIGGRGIAAQLVNAMIEDARKQGFRIDPRCSYVEAQFRRHPEWADLRG